MVGVSCRVWCVGVVSFVVLDVLGVLVFKFGAFLVCWFKFSSCWILFGVLVHVFKFFVVFGVFRCVDVVSSIFLHVWCFLVWCLSVFVVFGAVVWCLEVFVVGCLSLLCWWCLQVFVVLDAFGVVSSSFRRVWCLCCVGAVSLSFSSCLVPFWCVCVCVCVGVSSSFRRVGCLLVLVWCLQVFRRVWCLLVCWCGVFKYSCWMPFGVLCGAFKFSSCWVPFSVLVWCLQVFVVSWSLVLRPEYVKSKGTQGFVV